MVKKIFAAALFAFLVFAASSVSWGFNLDLGVGWEGVTWEGSMDSGDVTWE